MEDLFQLLLYVLGFFFILGVIYNIVIGIYSFFKNNLKTIIQIVLVIIGIILFIKFFPIIIAGYFIYLFLIGIIPLILTFIMYIMENRSKKQNRNDSYTDSYTENTENKNTYDKTFNDEYEKSYQILGLPLSATWEEIRERYKLLIKLYHPDRLQNFDDESRKKAEEMLKNIVAAYKFIENNYEQRKT